MTLASLDRPRALLLREACEPDPYVAALDAVGFAARCVPVLRFEPVERSQLAETMAQAGNYAGLILTSPRAADALHGLDLAAWRENPTFVVGPATAERARTLGLRPEGEEAGQADDLATAILAHRFDRPLLFLCGDRRRDTLPERLRAAGLALEERVVYRTLLDASALRAEADGLTAWVVFFSPSGVEAACVVEAVPWNRIRKAAIGPTTAAALRAAGFAPAAVAAAPTPEALAVALQAVDSR